MQNPNEVFLMSKQNQISCCKEANILEKRLTIYEYLLNYCIVQTDGEKVWMWLTKGEGRQAKQGSSGYMVLGSQSSVAS